MNGRFCPVKSQNGTERKYSSSFEFYRPKERQDPQILQIKNSDPISGYM